MVLAGLQKLTLLDFPGKVACTVFTAGCDLRCPFCHNSGLLTAPEDTIPEPEFFAFLEKRRGILDGVCVTGGEPTLSGYRSLDKDMQEGVLDYLSDMPLYEEVTVNGQDYLLIHQGIYDFTPDVELDWLEPEDFFSEALDPTAKYFEDKTIIVGHTPTSESNGGADRIFYGNGTIFIDCGLGRGGRLGCLRLEDSKEFYV